MEYIRWAAGMEDFEEARAAEESAGNGDGEIEPGAQKALWSAQTPDTGRQGTVVVSSLGGKSMGCGRYDYRRNDSRMGPGGLFSSQYILRKARKRQTWKAFVISARRQTICSSDQDPQGRIGTAARCSRWPGRPQTGGNLWSLPSAYIARCQAGYSEVLPSYTACEIHICGWGRDRSDARASG